MTLVGVLHQAGIHDTGRVCYTAAGIIMHTTDVLHSAGFQVGRNKNAALNVDCILEITGQLGKQSK